MRAQAIQRAGADAALLLAVPPDIEGGEGEPRHDGIRLGDGELLQQQRAEQKASRGEERGAQAGIAARQPLDQQRRQQHREHDRPARRPFVHAARQRRDDDGGPGQQDRLLGPALAIDLRLQPMAALDDVLRHGGIAALLIDEGAHREIGERRRGPDGDHQQQHQEALAAEPRRGGLCPGGVVVVREGAAEIACGSTSPPHDGGILGCLRENGRMIVKCPAASIGGRVSYQAVMAGRSPGHPRRCVPRRQKLVTAPAPVLSLSCAARPTWMAVTSTAMTEGGRLPSLSA